MKLVSRIILIVNNYLRKNSFKKKYKTKNLFFLIKIFQRYDKYEKKWQLIDIRNQMSFNDSHIVNSINVPPISTEFAIYKKIDRRKNILIINSNIRSNLNIYKLLKNKGINVYILYTNYNSEFESDPLIRDYIQTNIKIS
ncbi:rhodanese-like domain-containing protein [Spiroplasma endosymbiont of Aspidapion aeneum]|uniref:rhodanese-like domain-containing protein n=1 Tax=Spiroplasma endosymbiont of Aspidapion aeneum TaxID=3066276 RepID=UPI00313C2CD8